MKMYVLRSVMVALMVVLTLNAKPARADGEGALLGFYAAIKIAQIQAMKATANYYEAIGMGARAQQLTRLAADFESGSMGGEEGTKVFVQCSTSVEQDINELMAAGAYPTEQQRQLAKKAKQQVATAKVALAGAVAAGILAVVQSGGWVEKLLAGAIVAAEASKVKKAFKSVSRAAKAYDLFQLGGSNGFQEVSKEVEPQLAYL